MSSKTYFLVDVDGVLRREGKVLPGVPQAFEAMQRAGAGIAVISNNARTRACALLKQLESFGVKDLQNVHAISSADATAAWMSAHALEGEKDAFVIGEQDGIVTVLRDIGVKIANDRWNGESWEGPVPHDVVIGFTPTADYRQLSGAANAVGQGARFIATNRDRRFRNAAGLEVPANGAAVAYIQEATEKEPIVIGKPGIIMAETVLGRMGATRESFAVVIGDTFEQDVALAENLRAAGWNARSWLVLSGLETPESVAKHPGRADRISSGIAEVADQLGSAHDESDPSRIFINA